jgi:ArsR family transcriptional regulator, arsenate/arsenite/antimonite-responsive transcriptional repressor
MQIEKPLLKTVLHRQAKIMKALSHPSRLLIVQSLMNGERCVCELRDLCEQDMSTVSRHLSVLKNAGLLSEDKRGLYVFYKLTVPCLANFLKCVNTMIVETEGNGTTNGD